MMRRCAGAVFGAALGVATAFLQPVHAAAVFSVGAPIPVSANVFAVPIQISNAVNVSSWQFDLAYNAANAQINVNCDPFSGDVFCDLFSNPPPITEGDFFDAGKPFNVFNPGFIVLDASTMVQTGQLLAVNNTLGAAPPGMSGSGVLAFIEFITVGTGPSAVAVVNGSTGPTVPEPATLLLVAAGLMAAAMRRPSKIWRKTSTGETPGPYRRPGP